MTEAKTRKELVNEYKQLKPRMGVYAITNLTNGKVFIGSSINSDKIWNRYKLQLDVGNHPNLTLQADWTLLGEHNFKFEVLSEIEQKDEEGVNYEDQLKDLEKLFIEELQPFGDRGYNKQK